MKNAYILWRRVDTQGHDACRIERNASGWKISGNAAFAEDGVTIGVSYDVCLDTNWTTQSARVLGWSGERTIDMTIKRNAVGLWTFNGAKVPSVKGAKDIDLGFTPATNTSAIRRLKLDLGQKESSDAAWLDASDWQLKPLAQYYHKQSEEIYEYGSPAHCYSADLTVNSIGFVTEYPEIWKAV